MMRRVLAYSDRAFGDLGVFKAMMVAGPPAGRRSGRSPLWWAILACMGIAASFPATAAAAPGDLDPRFSKDGKTTSKLGRCGGGEAVAVQPDGRILVTARVPSGPVCSGQTGAVARFRPNGKPDRAFGEDGFATLGPGRSTGLLLLPDGKILVSSSGSPDSAVSRLLPDGSPDPAFGAGGTRVLQGMAAHALESSADGGILVGGSTTSGCRPSCILVAKLMSNGDTDTSFGENSGATGYYTDEPHRIQKLVELPGGAIAAGGSSASGSFSSRGSLVLARFTATGALDETFAGVGVLVLNREDAPVGGGLIGLHELDLLPAPGGAMTVATQISGEIGLLRTTASGGLDPAYGGSPTVSVGPFTPKEDLAWSTGAASLPDGRTLVGGTTARKREGFRDSIAVSLDFALVRIVLEGAPDRQFGSDGKRAVDFFTGDDGSGDLAVAPDGAIVQSGTAENALDEPYERRVAIARYESAPGKPDADADGRRDAKDRCPDAYSKRKRGRGCPKLRRKLTLSYERKRKRFAGEMVTPWVRCEDGKVQLLRKRRGRDKRVGTARARGEFRFPHRSRDGRFYVGAKKRDLTVRGSCPAVRSKTISP